MIKVEFGKTIRARRKAFGLTQEETALESDVALRFLQEIEAGESQPTITTLLKLSKALETTPSKLLQSTWSKYIEF